MLKIEKLKILEKSEELNIDLRPSETIHFISDEGKIGSDLFNILIGVERPFLGDVFDGVSLFNADFPNLAINRRKMGCMFNRPILLSNLSLLENMKLVLFLHQGKGSRKIFRNLLEDFGVEEYLDKRPFQVSNDILLIFSFIRLFIIKPKYIFIDDFVLPSKLDHKKLVGEKLKKLRSNGSIFTFFGNLEVLANSWVNYRVDLSNSSLEVQHVS